MMRLWRRRPRIQVEVEPYALRSFLRNPAVPRYEDWLPAGIAGRIRLPGYPHPFVMARRMYGDDELGPDAYRLMLPEDELRYGDSEDEWMVSMPESSVLPGPEGSLIDVVTTALDVRWDASPEAWEEARAWFVRQSDLRWGATAKERRSIDSIFGRRGKNPSGAFFDVGPFEDPYF
ncbi:hypothetical protein JOE38_000215 [Clavibacter michiganensis]|uniref:hypothetical protein n=1 Tax=Clavibacter michiganensis TaxID=28447 RepID=UPI00195BBBB1|nr:hypothetical protein [Clavibacter michiganensis]MBM7410392.1 hypothetical protein [Clavibacter michiganensis]